jgi:hypothetical protein
LCDKTPKKINLKEERFIFGFGGFKWWTLGSVISWPVARQNMMAACAGPKLLTLWWQESKERKWQWFWFLVLFWQYWGTQCLTLARQTLYHLANILFKGMALPILPPPHLQ